MEKENAGSAAVAASEKEKLWKRFCASGSITDYLAYSALRKNGREDRG